MISAVRGTIEYRPYLDAGAVGIIVTERFSQPIRSIYVPLCQRPLSIFVGTDISSAKALLTIPADGSGALVMPGDAYDFLVVMAPGAINERSIVWWSYDPFVLLKFTV